jgi:hypothetical protein
MGEGGGLAGSTAPQGFGSGQSGTSTSTSEAAAQEAVQRVCGRRRMAGYSMEPDLARYCVRLLCKHRWVKCMS